MDSECAEFTTSSEIKFAHLMPVCKSSDLNIPKAHQTAVTLCWMWWLCFSPPGSLPKYLCTSDLRQFRQRLSGWGEIKPKNLFSQPNCWILRLFLLIARELTWLCMSDARKWTAWVRIIDELKMLRLRWAHHCHQLKFCRVKRYCWGSDSKKSIQFI